MPTLMNLLEGVETGARVTRRNLQIMPLLRPDAEPAPLDYILAAEALARGELTVTEVDEAGSVPELRAVNDADLAVLLLDGEELVGAKQNRILNTDVLLRPRSRKSIPVSCVEQGRWRHDSPHFEAGVQAPPPLRARKSRAVSRNLRESGEARSDQGEVWDEVEGMLARAGAASDTSAMADAFVQHEQEIRSFVADLRFSEDAVGLVTAISGHFAVLDLFDRPDTFEKVRSRLLNGYAAEAVCTRRHRRSEAAEVDAAKLLNRLREIDCAVCPGVDLGEDWRFESADFVGSALVLEGVAMHLSAFPPYDDGDDVGAPDRPIAGPRQRRRHRR